MALEHPLRTARRAAGWSRVELGRRSGLSAQTVYLIESGRVGKPSVDTALALAEALGRPVEGLFGSNDSSGTLEDSAATAPATGSQAAQQAGERPEVVDGAAKE